MKQNQNLCRRIGAIFLLLFCSLLLAALPTDAEARIYEDTLRLHILANSDSEEDQAQKRAVRDRVLEKYGAALTAATREDAERAITERIEEIERDCALWVREEGHDYPVRATCTTEWYDTREYDGFTLPKGYYRSLRIIIGEGAGHNWFCVMYPPLCLDMATDAPHDDAIARYTDEEARLINGGGYQIKFRILEVFSELFAQRG